MEYTPRPLRRNLHFVIHSNPASLSVQITFDANNSLTVEADDRLGLYGSASLLGVDKLSVPYAVDDKPTDDASSSSSSFQLSEERFNDSLQPFVVGQLRVTVQDQSSPRTFAPYLALCTYPSTTTDINILSRLSIRPIRTAEDFEAVDWATGFANKHGCIVGLLRLARFL